MRIAQLINSLEFGGAEQMVVALSLGLQRRGHYVTVICLRTIGEKALDVSGLRSAGIEIVELHKPEGLHLPTLRRLAGALRERQIEVINSHNHLVHHYAAIAGRLAGVRAIVNTLHGTASLRNSAGWTRALFRLSCAIGDRVVGVCAQVRDAMRDEFALADRQAEMIDNGIDLGRFLAVHRREPGAELVFGTIGRLDPVKDHESLLRAFALLRQRHPRVSLRILGDGPLMSRLASLRDELELQDAVRLEGFSHDTPGFLGGIDVYVISSKSEGLPLSLLEAMGAGLPVVATVVGEIPGILAKADCGWTCTPQDSEALAASLQLAAESTTLSEKGRSARECARTHYSVERMSGEYEALYDRLLVKGGSAAVVRSGHDG